MYKHWLMKGLFFFFFCLEFTGIKTSTNEQERAQNEVVRHPKIKEEGIPSNSWLLGRHMEATNLNQPLMGQWGAATALPGPLPGALTSSIRRDSTWDENSSLSARLSTMLGPVLAPSALPPSPRCHCATFSRKIRLKHHVVSREDYRWRNCIQQELAPTAGRARNHCADSIALSSLETRPPSRQEWEICGMENTLKPSAYGVHLLREQPGSWALILCYKLL